MVGRCFLRQYELIGRENPSEKEPDPKIYKMNVFAKNLVIAKSRFWRLMRKLKKVKRSHGQILQIKTIKEPNVKTVKNYSILIRFQCATGVMNVNKEFRDTSLCGAVHHMYCDMASKHGAKYFDIDIVGTTVLPNNKCIRPNVTQFLKNKVKFPLMHRTTKKEQKYKKNPWLASRPSTYGLGMR
eukprot:NODE_4640_length_759_cov_1485.742089_g4481_i0.p1 GENE.NODE_4640_length_759_cov_1485.742089_g4481_i0~~NODE_4640_length_759_cov_1485.742089_g4481_i0.p1  ORF type:complete len:184 (+),score=35.91 NODE_4640_length_759_cov_1485.742089_g4481_i0:79-630(+)